MVAWGQVTGKVKKRGIMKGHEEAFWGDGYIHYLDCGDGFTSVYLRQTYKKVSLSMFSIMY